MDSKRKKTPATTPQVDALEGRQLLSLGGAAMPGMMRFAHIAHAQGGGHGQNFRAQGGHAQLARGAHRGMMARGAQFAAALPVAPPTTPAVAAAAVPAGTVAPSTPTTPATPAATPAPNAASTQQFTPPALSDAAKTALDTLKTDTDAVIAKSQVTVGQLATFRQDVQALMKGATGSPSQATRDALDADLKALNGHLPTDAQKAQLVSDYTALVKSQGVTDQAAIDKVVSDATAILTASNLTDADLDKLAADKKAVDDALGVTAPTDAPVQVPFLLAFGGDLGGHGPGMGGPGMGGPGFGGGMGGGQRGPGGPAGMMRGFNRGGPARGGAAGQWGAAQAGSSASATPAQGQPQQPGGGWFPGGPGADSGGWSGWGQGGGRGGRSGY